MKGPKKPEHEIYALKYAGPLTSSGAFLMWLMEWEKTETRNYYFWYIKGGMEPIVVDCGISPRMAKLRNVPGYIKPSDVLARIQIDPLSIKNVILTHFHWDHYSGIELFPNARFFIQEQEFNFWIKNPVAKKPPFARFTDDISSGYLASLEGTEKLILINKDKEIMPGIEVLFAPGHSPALQAVAVSTAQGTAILGSDAAAIFRNYKENWPSAITIDLVATLNTYDKLKKKASSIDLIFPGHDRRMLEEYPVIEEDITKLA